MLNCWYRMLVRTAICNYLVAYQDRISRILIPATFVASSCWCQHESTAPCNVWMYYTAKCGEFRYALIVYLYLLKRVLIALRNCNDIKSILWTSKPLRMMGYRSCGEKKTQCTTTWSIDRFDADVANSFIAIQCDVNKSSFDRRPVPGRIQSHARLLFKRNGLVGTWRLVQMMDRLEDATQQGRGTPTPAYNLSAE